MGETSPLRKADLLCTMPDDDDETDDLQRGEPPVIPTRGRSALVSRDDAPVLTPSGAASSLSAAPSSAPGARAPVPQAGRLSGFKLSKRRVDYTAVDPPTPAAKKRKEEAVVLLGTSLPAPAASPSVEKGSVGAHVTPARSSTRGLGENPREESAPVAPLAPEAPASGSAAEVSKVQEPPVSQAMVMIPSPPSPAALLIPGPSASRDVLERALSEMTRLREDLQGADPHLVAGRLELVSGWLHPDVSVQAALSQSTTTSEREKQAAVQAAAAREAALKDVEAAQDRCRVLEAELKTLRNEHAEEARSRKAEEEEMKAREDAIKGRDAELEQSAKAQATERGRLEELERKVKAEKAKLDVKAKVLAEDRATFAVLEERSRVALEEVVSGLSPMAEEEAHVLSSAALTRVFSHLHLCYPTARLDELLEPVDDEHCTAAAATMNGQVEAPLKKFRAFAPAPSTGGATNPAAPAGGMGEGDATKEGAPLAGAGCVQG
nr:MAP7 domain-containing protein 1-like [Aegilops tauschii subsp. strangulata]